MLLAAGADAEDDKNKRDQIEHPTGMTAARPPKIAESAKQVRTTDEQTCGQSCLLLEPSCRRDQGEPTKELQLFAKRRGSRDRRRIPRSKPTALSAAAAERRKKSRAHLEQRILRRPMP